MKTAFILSAILLIAFPFQNKAQRAAPQPAAYQQKVQSAPLLFMENRGQVADEKGNPQSDILFIANSGGAKVYLTATGIHYQFSKMEYPKGYDPSFKRLQKDEKQQEELRKQIKTSTHRFTVALQGANLHPAVRKQGQSDYTENYYLAQCPNGITDVHGYEKITLKNVYPNIDWVVYSKGGYMEYDFLVHPGGNPASIQLKIKDADAVSITPQGELLMKTSLGEVREKAPVSYADGHVVSSRFKQNSDGTIGFIVEPQAGKELRIDPSVIWATYYGNTAGAEAAAVATDKNGSVFMAGYTDATAGIAAGGFQNNLAGVYDGMVVKFNSGGSRAWATYYGGAGFDLVKACAVDDNGNVYCSGRTTSATGIAFGGHQTVLAGNYDAFLVKFNDLGARLWATYYGGSGYDYGDGCVIDKDGNVYLSGYTSSASGIAFSGHQNTIGGASGGDLFLAKFNSSGIRLWATYYGGSGGEGEGSSAVDTTGNVFLSGSTRSDNNIALNGHQNVREGDLDAFLVKFNATGVRQWATYYGNTGIEEAYSCASDAGGNVYLTGETDSRTGIAFNGHQNNIAGSFDAFLVKFNAAGTRQWATYYGGSKEEFGFACCIDNSGNVYVAGETTSLTGIDSGGVQSNYGGSYNDAFLVKFNAAGTRQWGTYYGGSNQDGALACAAGGGFVYLAGYTQSISGIATGGYQNVFGGSSDAFLAKLTTGASFFLCPDNTVSITSPITGLFYQWEVSSNGNNWSDIPGATSQVYQTGNMSSTLYGQQYRCRVNGSTYTEAYSIRFQTRWIGTFSSAWENPANWSCGQLPDGSTDVIINSGPIVLNSNGTCRTLTVRPGISFTITTGNTLTITR